MKLDSNIIYYDHVSNIYYFFVLSNDLTLCHIIRYTYDNGKMKSTGFLVDFNKHIKFTENYELKKVRSNMYKFAFQALFAGAAQ